MIAPIICPPAILETTLAHLREGGSAGTETVVLWLGANTANGPSVAEVYRPLQQVDVDYFRIPPEGMRALMAHIRRTRLQILAQVHSHPGAAFHSKADDTWAVVRHVGAVSIVVPRFARDTETENFCQRVATYQLTFDNQWAEILFDDAVEII